MRAASRKLSVVSGFLMLMVCCLPRTSLAWVEVGEAEGTRYFPFAAYQHETKVQYIIPASEILAEGSIEAIEFHVEQGGQPYGQLQIRLKSLPAGTDQFTSSTFHDMSSEPLFHGASNLDFSGNTPGWFSFANEGNAVIDLQWGQNLLIELLLRCTSSGTDSQTSVYQRTAGSLVVEGDDVWASTVGGVDGYLPALRLLGPRRTLLGGTWRSNQTVHITEDVVLPEAETLVIRPGVQVVFDGPFSIQVDGTLVAVGTADSPIAFFPADAEPGWNGLLAEMEAASVRLEHCTFEGYRGGSGSLNQGGAVNIYNVSDAVLTACSFHDCRGYSTSALRVYHTSSLLSGILVDNCSAYQTYTSLVSLGSGYASRQVSVDHMEIFQTSPSQGRSFFFEGNVDIQTSWLALSGVYPVLSGSVRMQACTLVRPSNSAACLTVALAGCEIVNCIFAGGPAQPALLRPQSSASMSFGHCLFSSLDGYETSSPDVVVGAGNLIGIDPLFADAEQRHLQADSPCIDAGDPYYRDSDLTRSDMGAFPFDQSVPVLSHLADVPADQGRQLQLVWQAGSMDVPELGEFGSYSVWREDVLPAARSAASRVIQAAAELSGIPEDDRSGLYWERTDGSIWNFVTQVPAIRSHEYGHVAPTLIDSTSSAPNPSTFKVVWHCSNHVSESVAGSASSVDNIPPDAVNDLRASSADGQLALNWSPVTTGSLEGSSYPELGAISYLVYHGDTHDFPCDESHLLGTTSDPSLLMSLPAGDATGFFRVKAEDTP